MKSCVIMSSYNGDKYILEQLESIKNQSRPVDEVFIVDDCSSDSTASITKEYIKKNKLPNWHIAINKHNLGWKVNFANMIKSVPKKYDVVFLCDQDDVWYKNKVEICMSYFERFSDIGLLVSNFDINYVGNNAKKLKIKKLGNEIYGNVEAIPNNLYTKRPGCVMAFNREFIQKCFERYSNNKLAHDMIIWMYSFCKKKIKYINIPLIEYRRFPSSSTFIKKNQNRLISKTQESIDALSFLKECKNIEEIDGDIISILDKGIKFENHRQKVFKNKNILDWFSCLLYFRYYPNIVRWFGDLYFSLSYKDGTMIK